MSYVFILEIYDSCEQYVVNQYAFSSMDKAIAKACQIEGTLFLDWQSSPTIEDEFVFYTHAASQKREDYHYNVRELAVG